MEPGPSGRHVEGKLGRAIPGLLRRTHKGWNALIKAEHGNGPPCDELIKGPGGAAVEKVEQACHPVELSGEELEKYQILKEWLQLLRPMKLLIIKKSILPQVIYFLRTLDNTCKVM